MSGIVGIVSEKDCIETLFYATDYHSHLGTEYGGMAVLGEHFYRQIHHISGHQFKSKFFDDLKHFKGNKGIGVISAHEEQPIYLNCKFGPFCIVTHGFIENINELAEEMMQNGISFAEMDKDSVNMTELVAKIISQGHDLIDGIETMFSKIKGSCSLLILHRDGIIAARDKFGYTPLIVGKRGSDIAVTTETCAFPNIGFEVTKILEPGEIVLISENGIKEKIAGRKECQVCAFLWIYTGFPASNYEGINTERVRERCGICLAKKDKDIGIDLVSGIPDSGVGHAIGYAMESRKPYRRPLVKYTAGYGRSYTPPTQKIRDLIATMKLIPVREVIEGNRIVVCEDSIVRGTQLKNFTINKLWRSGAKEVHVRAACPPLMFPCRFNLSTRSIHELAARRAIRDIEGHELENIGEYLNADSEKYRKMVEWVRKDIDVTTLRYQTIEDMIEAIGLPEEKLCLYCWTGKCPQSKNKEEKNCPACK